jgi:hypothetical protein
MKNETIRTIILSMIIYFIITNIIILFFDTEIFIKYWTFLYQLITNLIL